MNSTAHQFKYVMTPARTGSTAYHIYDKLQSIAGARRNVGNKVRFRAEQSGFFIINEFKIFFAVENSF